MYLFRLWLILFSLSWFRAVICIFFVFVIVLSVFIYVLVACFLSDVISLVSMVFVRHAYCCFLI